MKEGLWDKQIRKNTYTQILLMAPSRLGTHWCVCGGLAPLSVKGNLWRNPLAMLLHLGLSGLRKWKYTEFSPLAEFVPTCDPHFPRCDLCSEKLHVIDVERGLGVRRAPQSQEESSALAQALQGNCSSLPANARALGQWTCLLEKRGVQGSLCWKPSMWWNVWAPVRASESLRKNGGRICQQ